MNKNWNAARAKYNMEAKNLSSFTGQEVKDGFIGQSSRFAGETSMADGGNVFSALSDSDKILTIVVANTATSGADVNGIIFGAYEYQGAAQPAGSTVTVTVLESSHAQVREQSKSQPFWVNGLRLLVSATAQLSKTIQIQYKNPSGDIVTKQFRPLSYRTASQNQSDQIDAPLYKFGVDGSTSMIVPMAFGATSTFTLNIGGRYDASMLVDGASPLLVANQTPLQNGLVTVIQK